MAKLLKGKHKGLDVRIVQFCNDWFHVEHENLSNQESIKSPTALEFTDEEKELISNHRNLGIMMHVYEWKGNRLVKKRVFRGFAIN